MDSFGHTEICIKRGYSPFDHANLPLYPRGPHLAQFEGPKQHFLTCIFQEFNICKWWLKLTSARKCLLCVNLQKVHTWNSVIGLNWALTELNLASSYPSSESSIRQVQIVWNRVGPWNLCRFCRKDSFGHTYDLPKRCSPRCDVCVYDIWNICTKKGRRFSTLEIWHGCDKSIPKAQQIINACFSPLPTFQTSHCEFCH